MSRQVSSKQPTSKDACRRLECAACARYAVLKEQSCARLGTDQLLLQAAGVFIWSFFLGTFTHPDIWDDPDSFRPVRTLMSTSRWPCNHA